MLNKGLVGVIAYWQIVSTTFLDFLDMIFCTCWREALGAALDTRMGLTSAHFLGELGAVDDMSLCKSALCWGVLAVAVTKECLRGAGILVGRVRELEFSGCCGYKVKLTTGIMAIFLEIDRRYSSYSRDLSRSLTLEDLFEEPMSSLNIPIACWTASRLRLACFACSA